MIIYFMYWYFISIILMLFVEVNFPYMSKTINDSGFSKHILLYITAFITIPLTILLWLYERIK